MDVEELERRRLFFPDLPHFGGPSLPEVEHLTEIVPHGFKRERSESEISGNPAPTQLRMLPSKADEAADATAEDFTTPRSHAGSEPTPMSDPGDATTVTMESDDDPDDDSALDTIRLDCPEGLAVPLP